MTVSSLLNVCPKGAWVSEDQAVAFLGAGSKQTLKQKLNTGELKHVAVEHGRRANVSSPFSKHRFFFIQKQGTAAPPSIGLAQWVTMCWELENKSNDLPSMDKNTIDLLQMYTDRSINDGSLENDLIAVYNDLKRAQAIVSSRELYALPEDESDDEGYNYDPPAKASLASSSASPHVDGEVYVRADGKKVRRVKRASSAAAVDGKGNSLTSFLDGGADKGESRLAKMRGSQSVVGDGEVKSRLAKMSGSQSVVGDGEVYVRADGKKVRRVRKTSTAERPKESLTNFLDNGTPADTPRRTGSASVAGDQLTMDRNTSLTGEVYIRADGKKVRRVKKAPEASGDTVEIITRPDGTKVRRITKAKTQESDDGVAKFNALSGFLDSGSDGAPKKAFSGSHSVAGDQLTRNNNNTDGEIYIRADGKKVRRVKKVKPVEEGNTPVSSLSGLLDTNSANKPKLGSSATVGGGDMQRSNATQQSEIFIRPDGTKVRRVRKSISTPAATIEENESLGLGGFLDSGASSSKPRMTGSASVAGDQLTMDKNTSLTGEVYIRADGKKVRRVKKEAPPAGDTVEIITRPDGTKVRRIRKTTPKPADEATGAAGGGPGLGGFLDSTPRKAVGGGAATVGGDRITQSEMAKKEAPKDDSAADKLNSVGASEEEKKTLAGFFDGMGSQPRQKMGRSASVAGDQLAVSKNSSLTGEVYVRADGKKVRRVMKTEVNPGDQVEIITRPDGTKVRRIRRAKKPDDAGVNGVAAGGVLGGFLDTSSSDGPKKMGAASVAGDQLHSQDAQGEIYIRADGKKVRRIKKTAPAIDEDKYEIYIRPDGKKVRRIKRSAVEAKEDGSAAPAQKNSLGDMLGKDEHAAAKASSAATVAGDDMTGKSSLMKPLEPLSAPPGTDIAKESGPSLGDMLGMNEDRARTLTGAATVAGDDVTGKSSLQMQPLPATLEEPETDKTDDDKPEEDKPTEVKPPGPKVVEEKSVEDSKTEPATGDQETAAETAEKVNEKKDSPLNGDASGEASTPETSGADAAQGQTATSASGPGPQTAVDVSDQQTLDYLQPAAAATMPQPQQANSIPYVGVPEGMVLVPREQVLKPGMKMVPADQPDSEHSTVEKHSEDSPPPGMVMLPANQVDSSLPPGMVMVPADQAGYSVPAGMAMVPKEHQATTPVGIMMMPKSQSIQSDYGIPEGMMLVSKDQAIVPEGMVLVPKEQAARTIPEGMIAVPKDQAGDGVPEGFVLVPKDRVQGNPGDDLVLVPKDQVKTAEGKNASAYIVLLSPEEQEKRDAESAKQEFKEDVDISGANIVSMDDLPMSIEKLKREGGNGRSKSPPRFLLQPLPSDASQRDDFIKKNLLPKDSAASTPVPAPAPKPKEAAAPSPSIAELLATMSNMENFDGEKMGELLQKLQDAEKRQKKLEKQLAQAGVAVAEDIDYDICMQKVQEIGKRMNDIGGSDVTHPDKAEQNRLREEYFKLEQGMEKYNSALMLTDEYQQEQDRLEKKWEDDNAPGNLEALKKLRRHMPVEVRNMSEAMLTNEPTPNGKYIPKATAKKFKRTNVLQLIRRHPDDIVRMHPSTLDNMRVTGLTLTERRALYEHLRPAGPQWKAMKAEKMTERKWTWYGMMKSNFKENLASWQRHVDQYGPPGAHPYATRANPNEGCPLIGKQCPLKADKLIDYDGDYGYTDGAEYEVSEVKKADVEDSGAKAMQEAMELMREKKANERSDLLKKHYNGKLLMVSKANGSCESMDEASDKMEFGMTKWLDDINDLGDDKSKLTEDVKKKEIANMTDVLNEIKLLVLNFCERSGMQMSGKKKEGDDTPDPRSAVECSLSEEVNECFRVFTKFVNGRMKELDTVDTRTKSAIDMMVKLLDELHDRNEATFKKLGVERMSRSRKLKTQEDITKDIKERRNAAEPPPAEDVEDTGGGGGPPPPGPPRGGLMDAIKGGGGGGGRGGLMDAIGGRGRGAPGGGRGGLLGAIASAGRGGGGGRGPPGGGRGGLLGAITSAGRGGGGGRGPPGGGRGGLMDSIAGRGRGGPPGGGRGGLMDAIAGRGRGGPPGGGRGGLMDAIAGRGGGGPPGGGRGGLMDAIAGRGRGGPPGGGRGGLMDAIAGRGRGGPPGGGRGGLMAAIAARGGD